MGTVAGTAAGIAAGMVVDIAADKAEAVVGVVVQRNHRAHVDMA